MTKIRHDHRERPTTAKAHAKASPKAHAKASPKAHAKASLWAFAMLVAFALTAEPAAATTTTQSVTGTAVGALAIAIASPAVLTGLQAGSTASGTGTLILTDTNPSWTLSVQDTSGATPGHMKAAALGCTGSEASLQNPLSVKVTSLLGGVASTGEVSISGSNQTVASASDQLLAANVFTTTYTQVVEPTEVLRGECLYSLTATYTLQ
jgi:hypothetical protein